MGIDYSARLFGIVFSDIRLEFLERHTYYGQISSFMINPNGNGLHPHVPSHATEFELALALIRLVPLCWYTTGNQVG